jgi:hypothetical protein
MARKNTSDSRSLLKNRGLLLAGGAAALGALGAGAYLYMRRGKPAGASSLDTIPANPEEDRFGNRGEDNLVEPLTLREDQINMRDRMNPYNGLY